MIHGGKTMEPILKLEHIQKYYGNEGNITKAIRDITNRYDGKHSCFAIDLLLHQHMVIV